MQIRYITAFSRRFAVEKMFGFFLRSINFALGGWSAHSERSQRRSSIKMKKSGWLARPTWFTIEPACSKKSWFMDFQIMDTLPREQNFLGLEAAESAYASSAAVILPLPYEKTTSYLQGTAAGPQAIISASQQVEFFDDELRDEPCRVGIATLTAPDFSGLDHPASLEKIARVAASVLDDGKFLISLGGEHSVSIPLVREVVQRHPEVTVLQLDAHSDLRQEYEGSPLNHACVMARVNELCDFVSVGLRSGIANEEENIRPGSRLFYACTMAGDSSWQQQALDALGEKVYITFDLDFLDPSIMPSVGTPEPGGFLWYETMAFLRAVFQQKQVVACDVVELMPQAGQHHADFLAAKLVHRLIGYRFLL